MNDANNSTNETSPNPSIESDLEAIIGLNDSRCHVIWMLLDGKNKYPFQFTAEQFEQEFFEPFSNFEKECDEKHVRSIINRIEGKNPAHIVATLRFCLRGHLYAETQGEMSYWSALENCEEPSNEENNATQTKYPDEAIYQQFSACVIKRCHNVAEWILSQKSELAKALAKSNLIEALRMRQQSKSDLDAEQVIQDAIVYLSDYLDNWDGQSK